MSRFLPALVLWLFLTPAQSAGGPDSETGPLPAPVSLDFFWTHGCPHCRAARPFIERLAAEHPWVELRDHPLDGRPDNLRLYQEMAAALGEQARQVPAFLICNRLLVGYDDETHRGQEILAALRSCAGLEGGGAASPGADPPLELPLIGTVDPQRLSLPVLTLALGLLDAFNPCAFFVLLFLLSLVVHLRSRRRMLLVGGLFVAVSAGLYFLFMAAWLNLFLVAGELQAVTLGAGLVAIAIGLLNIKDRFQPDRGPTLSISEAGRSALFRRVRGLLQADNLGTLLGATLLLALAANSYELLCTAGFPMVYTRTLTLHALPAPAYYGYLALYNLVYVAPLLAILGAFVWTLGSRKLGALEGGRLKLISGTMMLLLGLALAAHPALLGDALTGGALLLGALALAWLIDRLAPRHG